MRGVLYVSHGSRVPEAVSEATSFIESVKTQVDVPLQETCFLELVEPTLSQGFQRLVERGATEISVVPVLLLSAGHYFKDIPAEIEENQQRFPNVEVSYGKPLGVQRRLTEILKDRIEETQSTVQSDAKILIVGRGSRNPQTQRDLTEIQQQLCDMLDMSNIEVCYLAACSPAFEDKLQDAVNEQPSQIFIVPYLWFTGILDQHIVAEAGRYKNEPSDIILCERLGHHLNLQLALKDRVIETFDDIDQTSKLNS
ncbi:sirohydrochlorin chelatase [Staphylococcus sp. Marseille-Q5304]|uniref:sirohydrochlorin chelatase n=1 Tax=Staphylococcus sp. Marseille-Q5304 TaxID=2942200 RepID=UPI0020742106|nr:sirohydrochlorin chelatase [Staphylococcus sp. Marseille-Q5304]